MAGPPVLFDGTGEVWIEIDQRKVAGKLSLQFVKSKNECWFLLCGVAGEIIIPIAEVPSHSILLGVKTLLLLQKEKRVINASVTAEYFEKAQKTESHYEIHPEEVRQMLLVFRECRVYPNVGEILNALNEGLLVKSDSLVNLLYTILVEQANSFYGEMPSPKGYFAGGKGGFIQKIMYRKKKPFSTKT